MVCCYFYTSSVFYRQINPCTDMFITKHCESLMHSNLTYKDQNMGRPTCLSPGPLYLLPLRALAPLSFSSLMFCLGPIKNTLEALRESVKGCGKAGNHLGGWSPELCPLPLKQFPVHCLICFYFTVLHCQNYPHHRFIWVKRIF